MSQNCEWFLSDGMLLSGKEAEMYLLTVLSEYEKLVDHMRFTLIDCLDNCKVSQENDLFNTIMCTGERLSIIQIQLELLLEKISFVLNAN